MKFSMFYNFHNLGDVLLISFLNAEVDYHERRGMVEILYNQKEIVGYNIFDISKIIKIKADGLLVLPPYELIDAINSVLSSQRLPKLDYLERSLFIVGEVQDFIGRDDGNYFYNVLIDHNQTIIARSKDENIHPNTRIVVALNEATLFDGSRIDVSLFRGMNCGGAICSLKDLKVENSHELLIVDHDSSLGADFFRSEVI